MRYDDDDDLRTRKSKHAIRVRVVGIYICGVTIALAIKIQVD